MRTFTFGCFACLALVFTGCTHHSERPVKSSAPDSLYNFGQIITNDTLKHTFYIKNTGDSDLKIDSVSASCDCMTLNWKQGPILPGKTGFINVAVMPKPEEKGKSAKYFIVRTNAANPLTVYKIFFNR